MQYSEKNLTKHDWKIHKQAHKLKSLTATINSNATRRKTSNEDLLSTAQGKKSKENLSSSSQQEERLNVSLLPSGQQRIVIDKTVNDEDVIDFDFDLARDYDDFENRQSEVAEQEDEEEESSKYTWSLKACTVKPRYKVPQYNGNLDIHYGKKREIDNFKICSYLFFLRKTIIKFYLPNINFI
jgi:hypothetical protein